MDLINKTFKINSSGNIVKVKDTYKDISILDNGERIHNSRLLDGNYYTECIDPNEFFNSRGVYDLFAEKIKSIDTSNLPEDSFEITPQNRDFMPMTNESAVIQVSEDDEIENLKRKYGASLLDTDALKRQNEHFNRILSDGDDDENIPVVQVSNRNSNNFNDNRPIDTFNPTSPTNPNLNQTRILEPEVESKKIQPEDPIIVMFRGVKRGVDFNFNFNFNDKIPRLDFIEMMEDSYEKSIIDFISNEFVDKILSDPDKIRKSIKDEILKMLDSKSVDKSDKVDKVDKIQPLKEAPKKRTRTPKNKVSEQ